MKLREITFLGMVAGFILFIVGMATGFEVLGYISGLIIIGSILVNAVIEIKKVFFSKI